VLLISVNSNCFCRWRRIRFRWRRVE